MVSSFILAVLSTTFPPRPLPQPQRPRRRHHRHHHQHDQLRRRLHSIIIIIIIFSINITMIFIFAIESSSSSSSPSSYLQIHDVLLHQHHRHHLHQGLCQCVHSSGGGFCLAANRLHQDVITTYIMFANNDRIFIVVAIISITSTIHQHYHRHHHRRRRNRRHHLRYHEDSLHYHPVKLTIKSVMYAIFASLSSFAGPCAAPSRSLVSSNPKGPSTQ